MQKGTTGQKYNVTNRRDQSISLRLSETEANMLREKAQLKKMSIVDFVVYAIDNTRVKGYNKKDNKEIKED